MEGYKIYPVVVNGKEWWPFVERDGLIIDPRQTFYTEDQISNLKKRILELEKREAEFENREGSVCPEDVPFEDVIERLSESIEMVKEDRDTYKAYWEFDKEMLEKTSKENKMLKAFNGCWENLYNKAMDTIDFYRQEIKRMNEIIKE